MALLSGELLIEAYCIYYRGEERELVEQRLQLQRRFVSSGFFIHNRQRWGHHLNRNDQSQSGLSRLRRGSRRRSFLSARFFKGSRGGRCGGCGFDHHRRIYGRIDDVPTLLLSPAAFPSRRSSRQSPPSPPAYHSCGGCGSRCRGASGATSPASVATESRRFAGRIHDESGRTSPGRRWIRGPTSPSSSSCAGRREQKARNAPNEK